MDYIKKRAGLDGKIDNGLEKMISTPWTYLPFISEIWFLFFTGISFPPT